MPLLTVFPVFSPFVSQGDIVINLKKLFSRQLMSVPDQPLVDYRPDWRLKVMCVKQTGKDLLPAAQHYVLQSTTEEIPGAATAGKLFHEMFEQQVDNLGYVGARKHIAVEYPGQSYHYAALEKLANRIAHYLIKLGVQRHDRVGVLFDRSIYSYAATLAVVKAGAAFVPLDAGFPTERIDYMLRDSGVRQLLTVSRYMSLFENINLPVVALDAEHETIQKMPAVRVVLQSVPGSGDPAGQSVSDLCYVIYTSGSTGKPKGVPITHANITGFLESAVRCYGYRSTDRVYQALTQAFDYSIEEIWLPLLCGATLVPAPVEGVQEGNLAGEDLTEFLLANNITAMCCVPTLLATIENDLPALRFLMVSGEACPQILVDKWAGGERRFLNTYGPTETTVSATWQVIEAETTVTIGGPLPGYSVVILQPDNTTAVSPGESGEICIAGIGVSAGYLNLAQQTQRVFIDDFIGIDNNPGAKIYRTGDLGLINRDNQIQYLGRIDSQIKIRGYRIELSEIESVLGSINDLSEVVVCATQSGAGNKELVVYYTMKSGVPLIPAGQIQSRLQEALPAYMVPAIYQHLDSMPHLASGKIDRNSLPAPRAQRLLASGKPYCEPGSAMERQLADILAGILEVERVSVSDNFFDDLAANSLLMAKFVTRIRRTMSVKGVSLKKLYQNPTISSLAIIAQQALDKKPPANSSQVTANTESPVGGDQAGVGKPVVSVAIPGVSQQPVGRCNLPQPAVTGETLSAVPPDRVSVESVNRQRRDYDNKHTAGSVDVQSVSSAQSRSPLVPASAVLCGVMQCVVFASYVILLSLAGFVAYEWVSSADSIASIYWRSVVSGVYLFFGTALVLIAVKWLAIGRFRVEKIPVWSARYLRFWIARTAVVANPLNMFRGTPFYNVFLRSLGAQIGSQAIIHARTPVCCDLVKVGPNTMVREDVFFTAYSAQDGVIRTGTIDVGARCYIGEASVLDINTSMAESSQLGHASALLENQHIPAQQQFHGSPAEPADTNFDRLPTLPVSTIRSICYATVQLIAYLTVALPGLVTLTVLLSRSSLWPVADSSATLTVFPLLAVLSGSAAVLYLSGIAAALISVMVIPRLIRPLMQVDTVHPVYSWQYYLGQSMNRFSNSRILNWLFGDSSMILHYLSAIGYDMKEATQTGSNFGVDQRQHSPFLCRFGRNTLVSDRLRMTNMQLSNSAYKISAISVPADMYLGNALHYPVGARIGGNCLIGTKTMIPIDGPLQANTGILGSPAFPIPRSVASDHKFDHYLEPGLLRQRLKLKLKSNLITLAIYMTKSWLQIFLVLAIIWVGTSIYSLSGYSSLPMQSAIATGVVVVEILVILLFSIFCERLAQGFRELKPLYCSLYDRRFWQHERFWKMNSNLFLELFNGTPLKPVFNRLRGVKIGANMFDDGVAIVEHDLVEIGDNCTFNVNAIAQSHSLEDGTFKSDRIVIGNNCNFGVGAFVHYGTVIQDNCTVLADSFVMKGAVTGANTCWAGNPASEVDPDDIAQAESETVAVTGHAVVSTKDSSVTGIDTRDRNNEAVAG